MVASWSRRKILQATACFGLVGLISPSAGRAQGGATLDKLKDAGVIRVGLANQPPYSSLNPDGTVGGFVPTLVEHIMGKLGIPKVEGFVGSYGELIPGLQAGRWDMIAASFRLTKERCEQVLFSDPVTFDGGAIAYIPSEVPNPPKSLADLAGTDTRIGILQGSYLLKLAENRGIDPANISQFPNNPALIDGLMAKRVPVVVSTYASLRGLQKARGGAFEIVYPVPDDPPVGSAPAFRRQDTELHAAFQRELRAMRDSGELVRMAADFGFDAPPADLSGITAEEACARIS